MLDKIKICGNCKHYTLYSEEAKTDINYCDDAKCRMPKSGWCKHWKGNNMIDLHVGG